MSERLQLSQGQTTLPFDSETAFEAEKGKLVPEEWIQEHSLSPGVEHDEAKILMQQGMKPKDIVIIWHGR